MTLSVESTLTLGIYVAISEASIYFLARKLIENEKKRLKTELEAWLNSENGQKALFSIGALMAAGMKSGMGLTQKGGKFKMEDLIGQIIGSFIQKQIPNLISQEQKPESEYGWKP